MIDGPVTLIRAKQFSRREKSWFVPKSGDIRETADTIPIERYIVFEK
jgi:hypothetical protein